MTRKLFWFVLLAISLFAVDAAAYGSYHLRSSEAQESGGQWHLYLRIDLPHAPPLAHMPVKFMFTEETEYERALTDNSKDPVLNRIPMQNQLPKVESMDVDFSDATGKIFKTTNYDFSLTRARGYEAGEWKMQIRTADGQDIGGSATITLRGDNPVVDRRSISFAAKPKEKKDAGTEVAQNDSANTAPTSTEVQAVGTAPPFVPPEGYQKTDEEEIKTKPGGCGCDMPGSQQSSIAIFVTSIGLLTLVLRKKRSQ
jgi:hypothetical protein